MRILREMQAVIVRYALWFGQRQTNRQASKYHAGQAVQCMLHRCRAFEPFTQESCEAGNDAKRNQGRQNEKEAKPAHLQGDWTEPGDDELRQECQEEKDHLWIGEVHDEAARQHVPGIHRRRLLGQLCIGGSAPCLPGQIRQVGRAGELEHSECCRRGGEYCSQAERDGGGMDQQAAAQTQHHAESGLASVRSGLHEDEQVVRTGAEAEEQRQAEKCGAGFEGGHAGGLGCSVNKLPYQWEPIFIVFFISALRVWQKLGLKRQRVGWLG